MTDGDLDLTEREEQLLDVAAERAMRRFAPQHIRLIKAVAAIGAILLVGTTVGWIVVSDVVDSIQRSRYELTRDNCRDQNDRNRATILKLGEVSSDGPTTGRTPSEALRRQIDASKKLIDAIIPYRPDCEAYARSRIQS